MPQNRERRQCRRWCPRWWAPLECCWSCGDSQGASEDPPWCSSRRLQGVDLLRRASDAAVSNGTAPGARARLIFCTEPDLHRGSLRAWLLPAATAKNAAPPSSPPPRSRCLRRPPGGAA